MNCRIIKTDKDTDFEAIKKLYYQTWQYSYQGLVPEKLLNNLSENDTWHPDWISPNLLSKAEVSNGLLHLISINGSRFSLEFIKGDFGKRLHDVALLSRANFLFLEALVNWGNCELQPPSNLGLPEPFENCQCLDHEQMEVKVKNLREMIVTFKKAILFSLGIEQLQKVELIKFYSQNLSRMKKVY